VDAQLRAGHPVIGCGPHFNNIAVRIHDDITVRIQLNFDAAALHNYRTKGSPSEFTEFCSSIPLAPGSANMFFSSSPLLLNSC
jgi:hypothetical protein